MDGNNSLKRLAPSERRQAGDTRTFDSDYILPRDWVNQFANEVKGRQVLNKPAVPIADSDGEASDDETPAGAEGDPTDGVSSGTTPCATNWKAASADDTKRMWGMFDETGIFACACRHGIILWIVDMVRSGEL